MTRRRCLVLVLGLVLAALAVAGPAPAGKSKSCAKAVVADWYGDGRVDKVFPRRCYREAIRSLPIDVLDYSNARQDILRALAFARNGETDPGPSGGAQPTGNGGGSAADAGESVVGVDSGPPGGNDPGADAGNAGDLSGPSSPSVPLLILAGLALMLLAAGGAGYLSRRLHARRHGGPSDPV